MPKNPADDASLARLYGLKLRQEALVDLTHKCNKEFDAIEDEMRKIIESAKTQGYNERDIATCLYFDKRKE